MKEIKSLPEMVTRKELAEYLSVCRNTLRNYELSGKLKPVKIGCKKYYRTSEISKLLIHEEKK